MVDELCEGLADDADDSAPAVVRFVARRPGLATVARVAAGVEPGVAAVDPVATAARAVRAVRAVRDTVADAGPAAATATVPTVVVLTSPVRRTLSSGFEVEFGVLAELVAEPQVTDIFVNGTAGTWVDRGAGLVRAPDLAADEAGLRDLAVRLMSLGGRHVDEASPCVDTRLNDGIRVHAVLPPLSPCGTLLSIRLPRVERATLDSLDAGGFFAVIPRARVAALVAKRENILITGAGGSGKTTFLSALLGSASSAERIIAIEDVAELRVDHPHFVALEARQPNLEGAGAIGLERLVREALRMRPDRLVLGECRGAEIRELLAALNTGHDGGAGTLHANSLEDVPARLEALGALAGMSATAVARQTVSAIGTVLHLERSGGARRIAQMGTFALDRRDRLIVVDVGVADVGVAGVGAVAAGVATAGDSGGASVLTAPAVRRRGSHVADRPIAKGGGSAGGSPASGGATDSGAAGGAVPGTNPAGGVSRRASR